MNLMKLYLLFFSLIVTTTCVHGQDAALRFEAADSVRFQFYHAGERICDDCLLFLQIDSLDAGQHLVDVITKSAPAIHFRIELELGSSRMADLRLVPDSMSHYRVERLDSPSTVDYTLPAGQAAQNMKVEVNELGSGAQCAPPLSPKQHAQFVSKLESFLFERDKVKLLETVLGNECLNTQQIRTFVSFIEDDERRLALLVKAYGNCFDIADFSELHDLLYLERNRKRFNMLFGD